MCIEFVSPDGGVGSGGRTEKTTCWKTNYKWERERVSESIKCWRREKGQNDKTQNAHKTFCQYICVHQEENYLKKQEIQIK